MSSEERVFALAIMRLRTVGLLLMLVLLPALGLVSCGLRPEREIEGNDSPEGAMQVQSGRAVRALLSHGGDVDFYRIAGEQRWIKGWDRIVNEERDLIVQIELTHAEELDPVIRVYRGSRLVKVIDEAALDTQTPTDAGFVNAFYSLVEVTGGQALISIEKGSREPGTTNGIELSYTLHVTIRPIDENEEREPNDKPVQATPVGFGVNQMVRGYFDPALNSLIAEEAGREVDWFSFSVPDSGERHIYHVSLSAVPNVDTRLSLYDELGYSIREANSNGVGEIEKLMSIGLERGTYTIKVESAGIPQKNSKVGYLLKVEQVENRNSEYETNDRYIFANDVAFNQDMQGYFNPVGDVDWFRMSIYEPQAQVLSVKISPTEDIDPVIEFHALTEGLIREADDRGIDEGEIIKNVGAQEGIYYIKVYNRNQDKDNPDNRYTLLVEKRDWQEDEEFEVNDTLRAANPIVLNGLKRGFISPRRDSDYFSFQVARNPSTPEEPVEVTLELSPCVLLDLAMHVYSGNGEFLEEINNNPAEEGERETLYLQAGDYFVEVFSLNEFENARDAYNLRVY
jgi:hypothetical protein